MEFFGKESEKEMTEDSLKKTLEKLEKCFPLSDDAARDLLLK